MVKMEVDESEERLKDENTWSVEWCERFLVNEQSVTRTGKNLEPFLDAIGHLINKSNEVAHKAWVDLLPQVRIKKHYKSLNYNEQKSEAIR